MVMHAIVFLPLWQRILLNYGLYVGIKIAHLRCDHCASWSVDEWSRVQAYIDELQRQHERKKGRKSTSSSSSGFDLEYITIPISE